jgi:hypothetical protein
MSLVGGDLGVPMSHTLQRVEFLGGPRGHHPPCTGWISAVVDCSDARAGLGYRV